MKSTAVTDLDFIVRLGYSEVAARNALQVTHGNRNAALYLLSKKGTPGSKGQQSWRKETAEEWVDGSTRATPNIAENRAVHKSPFYIFVEHYHTADEGDEYIFEMEVTLRDGRQWKVGRTYPEFFTLWASLPLGSCVTFKNSFPPSAALQFVFGELSRTFLEKRLLALCEWMRELTLNESCMENPKVLDLLYKFTDTDKNGSKPGQKKVLPPPSTPTAAPSAPPAPLPNLKSPLMMVSQDSMEAAAAKRKAAYYNQAPLLGLEQLPITPRHAMPFKINLKKLQCYHDLIGIKLSNEAKEEEDEVRKADEVVLAAAIAESEAEARLFEEQEEAERANRLEHERSTASPLHSLDQDVPSAPANDSLSTLDAKKETAPTLAPTYSLPPQIARAVDSVTTDVSALKRMQSTSVLNLKIDNAQLQKDCSRDRIVVQGKRLMGSDTHLDRIYALCQDSILQALTASEKKFDLGASVSAQKADTNPFADSPSTHGASTNPFDNEEDTPLPVAQAATKPLSTTARPASPSTAPGTQLQQDLERFSRVALSVISRTESGYLSHASLNEIFDMENIHQAADFAPYFFVPESALSDPLVLTFSVLEKGGAPQAMRGKFAQPALAEEWCIECSGETSTTYRLMDAMDLVPLLQIRVNYQVTLYGMPQYQQASKVVTGVQLKEGKCQILIDKVTTTTARDWGNCA